MPHPPITPVLLCGGSGTRLWPLSRKSFPKQFAPLSGDRTLFQAVVARLSGTDYAQPLIVTASDFRFIVTEQLMAAGVDPGAILLEPQGRNTAAAILAAALYLSATDPDALMLVAPTDHAVPDAAAFRQAVACGVEAARSGQLVAFGIRPDRAETGYGYLKPGTAPDAGAASLPLLRFVEKPDAEMAMAMVAAGTFLWNAGVFLFTARTVIAAFARHAPALLPPVRAAVDGATADLGFVRLAPGPWADVEDISFDYAVMERADNRVVVPYAGDWSDLGGWDSVWRDSARDAAGVAAHGAVTAIDCTDSLLRSESGAVELVGIGLHGIIAVAMADAVLVASMASAQDVKRVVTALKARAAPQAETFPVEHRPWGWFERLVIGERFQVKRIVVHPGAALSLQSHVHRSEHWIVVAGTARVTVDGTISLITENQSIYVPLGAVHRMENPGRVPMVLIEVQTGIYLGEDDIVRYDDIYARS